MNYRISPVNKIHLPELVSLERSCFAKPWSAEQYQAMLNQENFIVLGAFQDKNLRGYISFYFLKDEAEIINLAVHPDFRRMGLARSLVSKALNICRQTGVRQVFLEVRPSNIPAINNYQGFGFREVARRKNYYPDNLEDALVYSLLLSDRHC